MGFSKVTSTLLLVATLVHLSFSQVNVNNCFISDFYEGEVTVTTADSMSALEFAVAEDGVAVSDYINIDLSGPDGKSMEDNYQISCDEFLFCKLHLGVLFDPSLRIKIKNGNNMGLLIRQPGQAGDSAFCPIDGRNLNIPSVSDGFTFGATLDNDAQATLGGSTSDIPSAVLSSVLPLLNSEWSVITGLRMTYGDSAEIDIGTEEEFGDAIIFDVSKVEKVIIKRFDNDRSEICMIELITDNPNANLNYNLCIGDVRVSEFIISPDFRLAGFAMLPVASGSTFVPVVYQRLRPNVLYYERDGEDLVFYVKSFFATLDSVFYQLQYVDGLQENGEGTEMKLGDSTQLFDISMAPAGSESFRFTPSTENQNCGCYVVNVSITDNSDYESQGFKFAAVTDSFTAWTVGFRGNDVKELGVLGLLPLDYSGGRYFTYSVPESSSNKCPEVYPRKVTTGSNNEIWVDSWLGPEANNAFVPQSTIPIAKPITKVSVHVSGIIVTGLTFELSDGSSVTAGNTGNPVASGGELAPDDSSHYLMYIVAGISQSTGSQGQVVAIRAIFGQPKAPCWVKELAAEDYTTDLPNGDMRKVVFYAPADFIKVAAHIEGKFVAQDDEMLRAEIVPVDKSEFDRGAVYTAYLYHLKPHTSYDVFLQGTAQPDPTRPMLSEVTPIFTFTTGNGLYLVCTNVDPPTYTNRIDWSAIPEVEIRSQDSDLTSLGGTEDDEANAKNAQSFPADTYFHYPAGQTPNHPLYEEFRGYPKKIYLYRKNDNNCPEAVALEYDLFTGTQKIFIAGDAELVDELPRVEELEFPAKVTSVNYRASFGCLDSLSFGLATGGTTACLKADQLNGCTNTLSSPDANSFFMSSLNVKTNSDNEVTAIGVTWTSVDSPTLETNGAACELDFQVDVFDIRRSYWELEQNLLAGSTPCGFVYTTPINEGLHTLVYDQAVTRKRDSSSSSIDGINVVISRSNAWEVATQCVYNADGLVNSSYATVGEDAYKAVDLDTISFSMHLYKDHDFTEKYTVVPTLNLGQDVFIATEMEHDLVDSQIKNFECYATKGADTAKNNEYYPLSDSNGCPADATFQWDDLNDDHKDAFQFSSFGWVNSDGAVTIDQVYIHCTVRVCPTDIPEAVALCDARAASCDKRRARRDVSSGLLPHGVKEKTVTMDTPILVRRRNVEELGINRDPIVMTETRSMTLASLFGLFATVTFFCLMVIGYRIHTVRKGYYRLKNEGLANPTDN